MGISKGAASLLYDLKKDIGLSGRVLQLGKQDIHINSAQLSKISNKFGFESLFTATEKIDDVKLFTALGFESIESLDAADFEGADHIHDFNTPITDELKNNYDFVFDGGTLEHIFNLPQSLKNIFDLLKVGGKIIHLLPSNNHVDHGFYMFSPTLLWDYYTANNFKIHKFHIFEYDSMYNERDWIVYNYTPSSIDHLSCGGWGKKQLGIWCVAEKVEASTCNVIPQQGHYLNAWDNKENSEFLPSNKGIAYKAKMLLKSYPKLYKILRGVYLKNYNPRPPVIARY